MTTEFHYRFGEKIPQENRQEIVDMHAMWCDYAFRNVEDLNTKIGTYGDGISCLFVDGRPSGVCESWLIFTDGKNEDIPTTEKELRERADKKGNTRVLVTLTIKNAERSVRIDNQKLSDIYLRHILQYFHKFSDSYGASDFYITYSPDTPHAQKMHDRHDACYLDDDFLLENARPELVLEGTPAANARPRGYKWIKNDSLYVSKELKLAA